ncbi:thioredoxin-domain-containing protein [Auriculariales sp. MPI-PUGE-AT-0066]|nr:thioredoxin-domain-containing protein [Auriculariales sp. MPI-PUGE-AT-0066]
MRSCIAWRHTISTSPSYSLSTVMPTDISSSSQLSKIISGNKLTVIDFWATWCGPCKMMDPVFDSLSKQYPGANFVKVDTDAHKDIMQEYKVSGMPTFILMKGGVKVDQVRGADKRGLENAVAKHAGPGGVNSGAFTGRGNTLGGGSSSTSPGVFAADATAGLLNIDPQLKLLLGMAAAYAALYYVFYM